MSCGVVSRSLFQTSREGLTNVIRVLKPDRDIAVKHLALDMRGWAGRLGRGLRSVDICCVRGGWRGATGRCGTCWRTVGHEGQRGDGHYGREAHIGRWAMLVPVLADEESGAIFVRGQRRLL